MSKAVWKNGGTQQSKAFDITYLLFLPTRTLTWRFPAMPANDFSLDCKYFHLTKNLIRQIHVPEGYMEAQQILLHMYFSSSEALVAGPRASCLFSTYTWTWSIRIRSRTTCIQYIRRFSTVDNAPCEFAAQPRDASSRYPLNFKELVNASPRNIAHRSSQLS